MKHFTQSLQTKAFKHGALSALFVVIVMAVLVAVNVVAQKTDVRYDLTRDQFYSISDASKQMMDGLTEDVTIYPLFPTGQNDMVTDVAREIINQYSAYSKHIKVDYKDPTINPQFAASYSKDGDVIPTGSIIVESGEQVKIIQSGDLVSTEINMQTYQQQLKSIDIEPRLSNAIVYVTQQHTPLIYLITNHDEVPLPETLKKEVMMANYEFADLDLFMAEAVPDDCDLLISATPLRDWTAAEAGKVEAYLSNGGKGLFFMDNMGQALPNMEHVLAEHGVAPGRGFIIETDPARFLPNEPLALLPDIPLNDVSDVVLQKVYHVLMPYTQAIVETGTAVTNKDVFPLLVPSGQSYAKSAQPPEKTGKEDGDTDGPFNVAVAVTHEQGETGAQTAKLVVLGSAYILDEVANEFVGGDNYRFLINAMNWTQDKQADLYIPPKTTTMQYLTLTQEDSRLLAFLSVIVLPLIILGVGLFVWLRRRNS